MNCHLTFQSKKEPDHKISAWTFFRGPGHTEKTGVSNFECQNVDSQSELLDSTTLIPKFFLFGQGDTHLIFCLTVTRVSESL